MWIEPWKQQQWVMSRSGVFYLSCAFWAQLPFWFVSPFLVYVAYLAFRGKTIGALSGWAELFLGIVAGIGAIGGIALRDAMRVFYLSRSHFEASESRFWRSMLKCAFFVSPAYYWFVYRPQMREVGFD